MIKVLVTGAEGQLGRCFMDVLQFREDIMPIPTDLKELDIGDPRAVDDFFKEHRFDYCVNCAAYTAVDLAETEKALAVKINVTGVENLARACLAFQCKLLHVSTDFVFDGNASRPYKEQDDASPVSVYGETKLAGERVIEQLLKEYFILRTSWVYSEYGSNFMKTMIKLGAERKELNVVSDQVGTPTYAGDLAEFIARIIAEKSAAYGLYHYSNEGVASWFDFAVGIFELSGVDCSVSPIDTASYPTRAMRPAYSVLDKSKVKDTFKIAVPYWRESLKKAIYRLQKNQAE